MITLLLLGVSFINNNTFGSIDRQAPKVTLSASNIPLGQVFKKIQLQTGYKISNNIQKTDLDEERIITVNFMEASINEVMTFLLSDKSDLSFVLNKKNILIIKREKLSNISEIGMSKVDTSQIFQVIGKIIDNDGKPVPGASVKIKNNRSGTISNSEGLFRLSGITKGTTLLITSIGFESKELIINNQAVLIQLNSHTNLLDENVVIAYGNTTKRLNTGNIGSVKAVDLAKQPVSNPLLALQGRVPGLDIQQSSGLPGTGITVRIQGTNSLFKGNDPFYVIDGVPYISQLLPINNLIAGASGITGITGNPLNYINTADIESIEVLKDADATAIYGSRAANGAVLITTKKGKAGPTRISALFQNGWAKVAKKMPLLETKDYLGMRHEALKNSGSSISPSDWDLNGTWDTTKNIDWQKKLIGRTGKYMDAQFDVSGGGAQTQFLFGAAYHKETTVFPTTFTNSRGALHLNINNSSINQKFRFQFTGSYMFDDNRLPRTDLTKSALTLTPVAPDLYTKDGQVNWMPDSDGGSTFTINPIAPINTKSINKTSNLLSNATLSYEIMPDLIIKSSFGYSNLSTNETSLSPLSALPPEYQQYTSNATVFLTNRTALWSIEPQIEYNRKVGKGTFNFLLGSTLSQQNNDQQKILARGFTNELVMENLAAATSFIGSNINSVYKYNALYGRITYNLLDKYIINLTARRDGSSRFGPERQLHNFGAIGTAWIFSQESFFENKVPFLSFGKIRGSYGTTGNDQIGDYQFMDVYQSMLTSGSSYQNTIGLIPIQLTNPYLQWEETKKLQIGLELGFIDNRILFTTNYNRNRSANQLVGSILPSITGFLSITKNFPAVVQNKGWEFTLTTSNIRTKNLNWSTRFNITIPKNQLISYFGEDKNTSFFVGNSLTIAKYYNYAGINDTTGKYQFKDAKGSITNAPSDPDDKTVLANSDVKFYGGFQNSISYKGISLDIFFQFTKKPGIDYTTFGLNRTYPGFFNVGSNNQTSYVLDRWKEPGDKTTIQPYKSSNANLNYINNSSAILTDASFIRLKNISLSWQLPAEWIKMIHFQNARIFLNGQNILTITNYRALDPETGVFSLPPLRVITLGAQLIL